MKYHGWIIIEKEEGLRDHFHCDALGIRLASFRAPSDAVDFWDQRLGEPVKLIPMGMLGYRVYTNTHEFVAPVPKVDLDDDIPF